MTERKIPRDQGVPSGDLGGAEGTPEAGFSLDDGRVQFAPREAEESANSGESQIKTQIYDLLTTTAGINASTIQVRVSGDEVSLEGTVASQEERRLAENVAQAISTVRVVHNRLAVHPDDGGELAGQGPGEPPVQR
jgi:predicted kinase